MKRSEKEVEVESLKKHELEKLRMKESKLKAEAESLRREMANLRKQASKASVELEMLNEKRAAFQQTMDEAKKTILSDLEKFLMSLASEGERSAVVLGAERINVELTLLLKCFLQPGSKKEDNALFENEGGAFRTFARKSQVCHRLGLIDTKFGTALQHIRKLRNDFAHATKVETLAEDKHAHRVRALSQLLAEGNQQDLQVFQNFFMKSGQNCRIYLSCVMVLLMKLALVRRQLEPPVILLPAKLNYGKASD